MGGSKRSADENVDACSRCEPVDAVERERIIRRTAAKTVVDRSRRRRRSSRLQSGAQRRAAGFLWSVGRGWSLAAAVRPAAATKERPEVFRPERSVGPLIVSWDLARPAPCEGRAAPPWGERARPGWSVTLRFPVRESNQSRACGSGWEVRRRPRAGPPVLGTAPTSRSRTLPR